jgi:hypothetical protein
MLPVQWYVNELRRADLEVQVEKARIPEGLQKETFFVKASLYEDGYELRMMRGVKLEFRDAGQSYRIRILFHDESLNRLNASIRARS